MGFFMLSISLPDIRGTGMHAWYMTMLALVAGGALLRMAAVFLTKTFSSMVMMKGLSVFALVALFLTGLLGTAVLIDDGSVFTMSGIFCAAWTVLACFQIGSLYGAVKVVNPLGERFRAAFLVSSCLSVLAYIIFAVTLRITLGDAWDAGGYFWMSLIATALLCGGVYSDPEPSSGGGTGRGLRVGFLCHRHLFLRLCAGHPENSLCGSGGAQGRHGCCTGGDVPRGGGGMEPQRFCMAAVP